MGTSGSEGGQQKPTSRKTGRALLSDPYTHVPTWTGMVYVAFMSDVFSRRIIGWRAAPRMNTPLGLWMPGRWRCGPATKTASPPSSVLVHHTDAGAQGWIQLVVATPRR